MCGREGGREGGREREGGSGKIHVKGLKETSDGKGKNKKRAKIERSERTEEEVE